MPLFHRSLTTAGAALLLALSAPLGAQQSSDVAARLRAVLPADVAARVLARMADARSHGLPDAALANRALKFAAKGVAPSEIASAIDAQATRLEQAKDALQGARGHQPAADEIEAGAEAMRNGVSGAEVSALARSAPSGRSLAVPLYVVQSLMARGLPADSAIARVAERLAVRASDADLQRLPNQAAGHDEPNPPGKALGLAKHGGPGHGNGNGAGGPPAGVPGNGGAKVKPGKGKPATPPGQGNGKGHGKP